MMRPSDISRGRMNSTSVDSPAMPSVPVSCEAAP